MILVPFLQVRRVFAGDEAARGLFQEDHVLTHPGGPRQIENVGHVGSSPVCGHRRSMTTPPDLGKRTGVGCSRPCVPNMRIVERLLGPAYRREDKVECPILRICSMRAKSDLSCPPWRLFASFLFVWFRSSLAS